MLKNMLFLLVGRKRQLATFGCLKKDAQKTTVCGVERSKLNLNI
jgi:hypothetical protein